MTISARTGREGHDNACPHRRHVIGASHLGHTNPLAEPLQHEATPRNTNDLQHVLTLLYL